MGRVHAGWETCASALESERAREGDPGTRTSSSVTVQFAIAAGARYRLEQSPSLVSPTLITTGEEIIGTGLITERTVPASGQSTFYRLARLP